MRGGEEKDGEDDEDNEEEGKKGRNKEANIKGTIASSLSAADSVGGCYRLNVLQHRQLSSGSGKFSSTFSEVPEFGARLSNAGRWTVNYWPVLSKCLSNYNEISCAAFTPTPTKKKTLTSANIWLLSLVWIGTIRAGRYGLEIIWQYSWAISQYTIYQWWIFKAFEVFTEGPE